MASISAKKAITSVTQSRHDILAGIKVIIAITEGIPVRDMIRVNNHIKDIDTVLVGPNCPGVITPDEAKVGIMPGFIFKKGRVGIVSKSGTLTYEAADQVVKQGLGISTAIGIGGDPIIGTTVRDALMLFVNDSETETFQNYIFEPSMEQIVSELVPKSLKIQLFKALRDSFASEHGARMTAMHKATDNATELKEELVLTYNKARQAAITNEILEIVSGAEALKG